jgi:hypothetical protein
MAREQLHRRANQDLMLSWRLINSVTQFFPIGLGGVGESCWRIILAICCTCDSLGATPRVSLDIIHCIKVSS